MINFEEIPFIRQVIECLPTNARVYLVGGAIRDLFIRKPVKDYDFVTPNAALRLARRVADHLGGAYYPLDAVRETGRVIITSEGGERTKLDFANLRGPDLQHDLLARDFTINAMAIDLYHPQQLIDPLQGLSDLRAKRLRVCSEESCQTDPLRVLRGVRIANSLEMRLDNETLRLMRAAATLITNVSPERQRDELWQILTGPNPATALQVAAHIGALFPVLPELEQLSGVEQSFPHWQDVWEHTLGVVRYLNRVLSVFEVSEYPQVGENLITGLLSMRLGRYRERIAKHYSDRINPLRSSSGLLFLAALFHDAGKPEVRQLDTEGKIRFFEHEQAGARLMARRATALHFSASEVERLRCIVRHHMRPLWLAQASGNVTRRAIYRFFRDTGAAGVDICCLSLADVWATFGASLTAEIWERQLALVADLFESWWEHPQVNINPTTLVSGTDLIGAFGLAPGPRIGEILEAIREAQASGEIETAKEALEYAAQLINGRSSLSD